MIEYHKISDNIREYTRISDNVAESDNIEFPIYNKKEHQRISVRSNIREYLILFENIRKPHKIMERIK